MENFPINPVDLAVFAVLLLAALLAFTRGAVAEVLSLAAWAGAVLFAMHALPFALPLAKAQIGHETIAYGAAAAALFVIGLVFLKIAFGFAARWVQNSSLSAVDRSLGFAFGLFKGGVLVSIAYLFFAWLVPMQEHPAMLQEARTRPLAAHGAALIYDLVPPHLRTEGLAQTDLLRARAEQAVEAKRALDRLSTPVPGTSSGPLPGGTSAHGPNATDAPAPETGYNDRVRGDLERLIQNAR